MFDFKQAVFVFIDILLPNQLALFWGNGPRGNGLWGKWTLGEMAVNPIKLVSSSIIHALVNT